MPLSDKADLQFFEQFEPDLFWQKHGQKITWGLVAILAVVAVVVYSQRQAAEREERAAVRLSQATDPATLQELAQDYKGRELGAQALLRLADLQSQGGHPDIAATTYHDFVASYPQNPLVDTALLGQAEALETLKRFDEAKSVYQQLIARPSYANIAAKVGLARCCEALHQDKEAAQYYEELLRPVENTPWEVQVAVRLAVLGRTLQPATNQPAPAANAPGAAITLPGLMPAPAK